MGVILRLLLAVAVILGFGFVALYNRKLLAVIVASQDKTESLFYNHIGRRLRKLNKKVYRQSTLHKGSLAYKVYTLLEDMIVNLDMVKDNVTVVGLLTFIMSISLAGSLILVNVLSAWSLLPFAFGAVLFLTLVLFRFLVLIRYERREAEIMDALDLIVSDAKGGVYNAIVRYKNSFHPNVKPYFLEFVDDVQNKGYSFRQALLLLNAKLGINFTDFTHKALIYEEKADKNMDDIFSSIIDTNRQRRTLRHINAQEFAALYTQFVASMVLIFGFGLFSMALDSFLLNFFLHTFFGRVLVLVNIVIIAAVLSYLASLKARAL